MKNFKNTQINNTKTCIGYIPIYKLQDSDRLFLNDLKLIENSENLAILTEQDLIKKYSNTITNKNIELIGQFLKSYQYLMSEESDQSDDQNFITENADTQLNIQQEKTNKVINKRKPKQKASSLIDLNRKPCEIEETKEVIQKTKTKQNINNKVQQQDNNISNDVDDEESKEKFKEESKNVKKRVSNEQTLAQNSFEKLLKDCFKAKSITEIQRARKCRLCKDGQTYKQDQIQNHLKSKHNCEI